ncbi:MAG: glycosyltransferase family 4 protein [Anaerolineae bacterium]|nr:glycosyltransferase family 4 protein [Anaerolineae bacterium]
MFSNLFPPVVSGSATQSAALASELVRRGHQVCLITAQVNHESAEYEGVEGVEIHRLPALRLPKMGIALNFPWLSYTYTRANLRRVTSIVEQFKPDVLHLHNHMFDLSFSAVRMRKQFGIPLVVTLHTVIKHSNPIYNAILSPIDRLFLRRWVIRQSDMLIHPDVNIEQYALEAFGAFPGIIIPYGIAIQQPDEQLIETLRSQHNLQDKRVILSLGHVHEIRNRKDLVAALPDVLATHPNTVLLIVGTVATKTPALLAQELGVKHAVIFTGAVPHAHIPAYLALADLEAHWLNQDDPIKTSLGIASLEAMSMGKVVMAAANSDTYGPKLLRDGENFVLVKTGQPHALAQQIVALLDDPMRREDIGAEARATIEGHFSWDNVCAKTVALYQQLVRS